MTKTPQKTALLGTAACAFACAGLVLPAGAAAQPASISQQQGPLDTTPEAGPQPGIGQSGLRGARAPSARQQVLPSANLVSQWSISANATYSDNFRRLSDDLRRSFLFTPEGTDQLAPFTLPVIVEVTNPLTQDDASVAVERRPRDTISIDPPDNVIATLALNGGTVLDRPGVTGIVQGGISISAYADTAPLDERLADDLAPQPSPDIFDGFADRAQLEFDPLGFVTAGSDSQVDPVGLPPLIGTTGRTDVENVFIEPNLRASATARLVQDLFFVDASAIAQQEALNLRNQVEQQSAGRLASQVTFIGGSLSPYVFRNLQRGSTVEARYRFTGVFVADESRRGDDGLGFGFGVNPDDIGEDQRFSNDSIGHEGLVEYRSGELLGRTGFALRGLASRSEEDGSDLLNEIELERLSGSGEVSYDVNRSLTVLAEAGYDDVDFVLTNPRLAGPPDADGQPTTFSAVINEDELSGFFWQVGFVATPGRRTRAAASFGDRFGGTLIEVDATYQPTARLTFDLGAERQLATGTQDQFNGFGALNSRALNVVEQLSQVQGATAQRLLEQVVSFQGGFNDVQQRQAGGGTANRYRAGMTYNRIRTSVSASVSYAENEFAQVVVDENGQRQDLSNTNENFSVNVAAQHALSRRFSVNASARYLRDEGLFLEDVFLTEGEGAAGPGGADTSQTFVSVGGAYQIGPRFALTASAYRAQRRGGTNLEFDENAASAGVRWTF